jgi:hypothetical protein
MSIRQKPAEELSKAEVVNFAATCTKAGDSLASGVEKLDTRCLAEVLPAFLGLPNLNLGCGCEGLSNLGKGICLEACERIHESSVTASDEEFVAEMALIQQMLLQESLDHYSDEEWGKLRLFCYGLAHCCLEVEAEVRQLIAA